MRLNSTLEQFELEHPCTCKLCRDYISRVFRYEDGERVCTEKELDELIADGFNGINGNFLYAIEKALEELEKLKMEQYL